MLSNTNGAFHRFGPSHPAIPGAEYHRALSGDLQNDRFDDIVVLGKQGSHVFRFQTNGLSSDVTAGSGLARFSAADGLLVDLDFTGKLDLLAVADDGTGARLFRQFGPLNFQDITRTSGLPANVTGIQTVGIDDWNRDGSADVVLGRTDGSPMLLEKKARRSAGIAGDFRTGRRVRSSAWPTSTTTCAPTLPSYRAIEFAWCSTAVDGWKPSCLPA